MKTDIIIVGEVFGESGIGRTSFGLQSLKFRIAFLQLPPGWFGALTSFHDDCQ